MSILIKGARVIDPASGFDNVADVFIERNLVKKIAKKIDIKAGKIINGSGKVLCPGFIDPHVHLREPGFEEKETIETGCRAAIAGGVTSLLCMSNTSPAIDNPSLIEFIIEKSKILGLASVYPVASLTKKSEGEELSEMHYLAQSGAVAYSDDGHNINSGTVMRRALEYSSLVKKPVLVHAEDEDFSNNGQINEGLMSTKLGLKGLPSIAEDLIVYRDIELARLTGAKVHFMHVSTANSVDLIRAAKKEGLNITCEVTPHHLLLDDSMLVDYDTNLKVKPPLRSKKDIKSLYNGLKDNTIDCFASDHAPHAKHQKEVEFDYAAFGMVGIETMFNLIFTYFEEKIGLVELISKFTSNTAKIFDLDAGSISEGKKADIVLFNPNAQVEVDIDKFYSKSCNSPFNGWKLKGKIINVIKDGRLVFENSEFV